MARNALSSSSSPDLDLDLAEVAEEEQQQQPGGNGNGGNFHYSRLPIKRNTNNNNPGGDNNISSTTTNQDRDRQDRDRQWRSHRLRPKHSGLKGDKSSSRRRSLLYLMIFFALFVFAFASIVLQTSIMSLFRLPTAIHITSSDASSLSHSNIHLKLGTSLFFTPSPTLLRRLNSPLDRTHPRLGIRPPTIALILGNLEMNPQSLMLFTVVKNLKHLGYLFKIYAVHNGRARPLWEQLGGGPVSVLESDRFYQIDWLIFQGIVVDSLQVKESILSLMQEPFCSVPLIWIIQEQILADRLPEYQELGWEHLISYWKNAFSRADIVVFPDFSLPILHSVLDTGNFYVIPASPADVWAVESYYKTHSKRQLREDNGFDQDDMIVLIIGSSFFYNELSWDNAFAMHAISPLLIKYARRKDGGSYKFVFVSGNSTGEYDDALQDVASRLGLLHGSLRHYGMGWDVNGLLLMADIVVYASSQDVQGVPPLLIRAMSFGTPIVSPDYPVISKHIINGVHGMLFPKNNQEALMKAFSLLISNGKLSKFAQSVASSGRLLAKNIMASECITSYAKLLETIFNFPSDTLLPAPISRLENKAWEWSLFWSEIDKRSVAVRDGSANNYSLDKSGIVYALEENLTSLSSFKNIFENETGSGVAQDIPTKLDWDILKDMEDFEDFERREMEEIEERMEKDSGVWDDIYRNARRAEKLKFEANERDEGELERTGQPICIYEIYSGAGSWPFLHHGSMYRGLSLTTKSRRLTSDDVDAVARLPLLNDTYYRDILCEIGGMFSIANKVDNIHKRPWIGFQSWHAAARKDSLSIQAEKVLEGTIEKETKGDVLYFWSRLKIDGEQRGRNDVLTFWSMCDMLNGGNCRSTFQNAFRHMYSLPTDIDALPPMPEDGGHWSALHSWAMPTQSFMEFTMFSRMFVDSLDSLHSNTSLCFLSSSEPERKHCYCRVMELLVNVWAYHSGRKMVYIDPRTGLMEEQHGIEERKGLMWAKYFDLTLLKSMDEDLAEAADDEDGQNEVWLWPLTGEVQWQGIYDREREERYRLKMDKKRKMKERMMERMQHGYKQKTLGGG